MISLAVSQHAIDTKRKKLLDKLHEEIVDYARLKKAWGYGHIELITIKSNFIVYLSFIYGHYVTARNEKKKIYLGYNFKEALNNVDEKQIVLR